MENFVLDYIKKNNLIRENDKILVAVSGGPDSICLLNILYNIKERLKIELYVAHVNHLIRKEAKSDAEFVKEFCDSKNIEFFYKECDVKEKAQTEKISTEEAGRNARYEFFEEIANKYNINKIAIGHNKNDLAETLIMNILRGTGTQGLKAILNKNGKYIRPLLDVDREKIEEYCEKNNLKPRIDLTNFENNYTRNKIRNIVIPYVKKEFNPNIVETLTRLSQIVTEEQDFINLEVEKAYKKILLSEESENIKISGKKFVEIHTAIQKRTILHIINRLFGNTKQIEKKHIEDIIKLINKNIGNKYLTPNKNLKVSIKKGIVEFKKI